MKQTLITLLALLLTVVGTKAEVSEIDDSLLIKRRQEHVRRLAEHSRKLLEHARELQKKSQYWGDSIRERFNQMPSDTARWRQDDYFVFPSDSSLWGYTPHNKPYQEFGAWPWEGFDVEAPVAQPPLIDLSNIKGHWGFEDYYFSGDILHAQARRGDFYINGWNIRPLLKRLSGLLVLKSKKKAAEKIIFSRETQLRNDKRFQPIVRDRGITIYGHHTKDNLLDEVIILLPKDQSPQSEHVCIIQMMGLLRSEDLTTYRQLREPSPKPKVKQ
ncbi:MAG: hypothetical protein IJ064_04870 [Bacteroidaceae bacterium]|nr:hypothetical protein [Bacteroidaceae bacterium]